MCLTTVPAVVLTVPSIARAQSTATTQLAGEWVFQNWPFAWAILRGVAS